MMIVENKICVCMPHYNSSEYVGEAIQSIKNQNYKNWHLYIYDDGSNACHLKILKKHLKSIKGKYTLIEGNHVKTYIGRLKIYEQVNGDIVVSIDSDDLYTNSNFFKEVNIQFQQNLDLLLFNFTQDNRTLKSVYDFDVLFHCKDNETLLYNIKEKLCLYGLDALWCKAFSTRMIPHLFKYQKKELVYREDRLQSAILLDCTNSVKVIDEAYYYQRPNNKSVTNSNFQFFKLKDALFAESIVNKYSIKWNIHKYNYESKLINMIFSFCISFIASGGLFKEWKDLINNINNDIGINKIIKKMHFGELTKKRKILIFLINKNWYFLSFMLCKIHLMFRDNIL